MDWLECMPDVDVPEKRAPKPFVPILDGQTEIQKPLWFHDPSKDTDWTSNEEIAMEKSKIDWLYFQKKFEAASIEYNIFLQKFETLLPAKDKIEILESILYCHYSLKDYQKVLPLLIELIPLNPWAENEANLRFVLSKVYNHLGDQAERMKCLQLVISSQPKHTGAWYSLGNCYLKQNQPKWATISFQKCLFFLARDSGVVGEYNSDRGTSYGRKTIEGNQSKIRSKSLLALSKCQQNQETEESTTATTDPFISEYLLRQRTEDEEKDPEDKDPSFL